MQSMLDFYARAEPSAQLTVDIFKGEWLSILPGRLNSGWADLFTDARVAWPNTLFDISGKSVLELGPLEGGQTFALHNIGAKTITAVEANSRAFLKCLIVKELFDLVRVKLLFGDFVKYLETTGDHFDIIFASGVLYHMSEPLKLLYLIKQHTNQCYLWTHYFDQSALDRTESGRFGEVLNIEYNGYHCDAYPQYYGDALDQLQFAGGNSRSSLWLDRNDILSFLSYIGFTRIETNHENTSHPNGPSFSVAAQC
jgi:Protein of unknown function (DUF1698)